MSQPSTTHWLAGCGSVLLVALVFSLTLDPGSLSSPASQLVNLALLVSVSCYLLLPGAYGLATCIVNSSCATLLFVLLAGLTIEAVIPAVIQLRVCAIVFCLGMLLWSLAQLFRVIFPASEDTRTAVVLLAAIAGSAPIWLGPVVDLYQPGSLFVNLAVSATPLTHVSVAAEYDYLRGDWLYRHSPFGSLPFVYPGFGGITVCYLLLVVTVRSVIWGLERNPGSPKSLQLARKNFD